MALSDDQKVIYLANIVQITRADGKLVSQETEALEAIQKAIGAKKVILNKAYSTAETQGFKMVPVGHWTDQVKNLEDIIYVSMVDGSIDATEKPMVLEFAKLVKVSKEQFNVIANDVKTVLSADTGESKCAKCGFNLQRGVKFCPECGTPTVIKVEKKSVSVSYEIPTTGVTIEFAESTAGGFPLAVKVQQSAPINASCIKGKKEWYMASWPITEISQAIKLVENLKGLRNRKVYVDGEELQWENVFGFMYCYNLREQAYRPFEYCFGLDEKRLNIWGCKQARMEWVEWANFFTYGTFKETRSLMKKQAIFTFDKKRIRHELETNLFKCRFCPHLNSDLIEAIINEFPNEVTPSEGGGEWGFQRDYKESPGSLKIISKSTEAGYTYTDEYYSTGVVSNTIDTAMNILKKAADSCGYRPAELHGVLAYKGDRDL